MKKLTILLLLTVTVFLFSACNLGHSEDTITISLESNVSHAVLDISPAHTVPINTEVTVTAESLDDYTFKQWENVNGELILNQQSSYTFIATSNITLRAVYTFTGPIDVNYTSNIESPQLSQSSEGPFNVGDTLTLFAEDVIGHTFSHFLDIDFNAMIAKDSPYTFLVTRSRNIEAVYVPVGSYAVQVESNLEQTDINVSPAGPYELNDTITLTTQEVPDYHFLYWYDYFNDTVLSESLVYEHTVTHTRRIIAVYMELGELVTTYQTGFEDASKSSYAAGDILSNGRHWYFDDALIGVQENDQKLGNRSVRLRNGNITTMFSVMYLENITYYAGRYLSDTGGNLVVEISADQTVWHALTTIVAPETLTRFDLNIDTAFLDANDLALNDSLYVRFRSDDAQRINIDGVSLSAREINILPFPEDTPEFLFPNNSDRINLTIDESATFIYSLDDLWNGDACHAYDDILGAVDCYAFGSVDTTAIGTYTITYYAIDEEGYYASQQVTKHVLRDASLLELELSAYDEYYIDVAGLFGEDLLLALREIIEEDVILPSYDDARTILPFTDQDPNKTDHLIVIYLGDSVLGEWDNGVTWNREHVWPVSRMPITRPGGSTRNMGSDLHNLAPANPSENNSRGFKYFDWETTSEAYEPRDEVKGDVARMLFYMITMYEQLSLVSGIPSADLYQMGDLDSLLNWHYIDPVDAFEINRNEIIYTYQNNRNPFIDYPHLVELIWWNHPDIMTWFED